MSISYSCCILEQLHDSRKINTLKLDINYSMELGQRVIKNAIYYAVQASFVVYAIKTKYFAGSSMQCCWVVLHCVWM